MDNVGDPQVQRLHKLRLDAQDVLDQLGGHGAAVYQATAPAVAEAGVVICARAHRGRAAGQEAAEQACPGVALQQRQPRGQQAGCCGVLL